MTINTNVNNDAQRMWFEVWTLSIIPMLEGFTRPQASPINLNNKCYWTNSANKLKATGNKFCLGLGPPWSSWSSFEYSACFLLPRAVYTRNDAALVLQAPMFQQCKEFTWATVLTIRNQTSLGVRLSVRHRLVAVCMSLRLQRATWIALMNLGHWQTLQVIDKPY